MLIKWIETGNHSVVHISLIVCFSFRNSAVKPYPQRHGNFREECITIFHANKTVLLRERKRHTDRRLSSTPCAVLYRGGRGGTPGRHPLAGGTLGRCSPDWGTPLSWPGQGVPQVGAPLAGVPPSWPVRGVLQAGRPLAGVPPHSDLAGGIPRVGGVPPSWLGLPWASVPWLRYPPSWPGWGVPWAGAPWLGYPSVLAWLGVPQAGTPWLGFPHPDLARGTLGGYPPGWGTSLARSNGGYLRWGTPVRLPPAGYPLTGPGWGTPQLDLAGGYHGQVPPGWDTPLSWPDWGYPRCAPPGWGSPILTWPGVPWVGTPLAGVPPWPGPMGGYLRWGTPVRLPPAGYPPDWTWLGYPPAGPGWGVPWAGAPWLEYPSVLTWLGVPQVGTPWLGFPPSWPGQGYLGWAPPWLGYPPHLVGVPPWPGPMGGTWGGVPPVRLPPAGVPPDWTWLGYPPRCGQTDGWMDRHVSKHNLPSYYVRGR